MKKNPEIQKISRHCPFKDICVNITLCIPPRHAVTLHVMWQDDCTEICRANHSKVMTRKVLEFQHYTGYNYVCAAINRTADFRPRNFDFVTC